MALEQTADNKKKQRRLYEKQSESVLFQISSYQKLNSERVLFILMYSPIKLKLSKLPDGPETFFFFFFFRMA